jgi:hypothetical protein
MKIGAFYPTREQYPISHGNWQSRWKFSITPNSNTLRWTVKNTNGQVKDLDSETHLVVDSLYNVTGVYSGSNFEIYLNGQLDAFTLFSGLINDTTCDLTIGQDLPHDNQYNFNGILDDIRIYDYALSVQQIANLFDINTAVTVTNDPGSLKSFVLYQNYPNPFNPSTIIRFNVPPSEGELVRLEVYDVLGRRVDTLLDGEVVGGLQEVVWNAGRFPSGVYYCRLTASAATQSRKMILVK